ncbi:hypothetical protein [Paraburkholderia sacchari]|uniref:hypothetical protein n=1 Tax=Paraburkholderia sacchari TaxID=159450 RepID=UPI000541D31A|nr:hypothetical protein [Paraburkholderia sacchari]NLP64357.1 hypothetical protein [Paraburkholderia sacchari]
MTGLTGSAPRSPDDSSRSTAAVFRVRHTTGALSPNVFRISPRMGVTDDEFEHAVTRARKRFAKPSWTSLTKYLCDEVADRLPVARDDEGGDKRFFDRRAAGDGSDAARAAADFVIDRARRAARTSTKGTT